MKEVIVHPLPTLHTEIHDIHIPVPGPDEVLIKVIVAGSNVKGPTFLQHRYEWARPFGWNRADDSLPADWLHITAQNLSINSGDDMAGIVHALGTEAQATCEFRVGDRVAAFHPMLTPGGTYAEYALAPVHTVFKLPARTSFEEAATIPLVSLTAAISLFCRQSLPPPWSPQTSKQGPKPLIIYGASSALGTFAVKLAKLANIHPIIAICGSSQNYVSTLLDVSKGDAIVDYRHGVQPMMTEVREKLGSLKATHALDAISSNESWIPLAKLVDFPGGQISVVSGANAYDVNIPTGVDIKYTYVGTSHYGAYKTGMPKQPGDKEAVHSDREFAFVFLRYISRMLAKGKFEGHPTEIIPGGLDGVQEGLQRLKKGEAKGIKFVYRICETSGL